MPKNKNKRKPHNSSRKGRLGQMKPKSQFVVTKGSELKNTIYEDMKISFGGYLKEELVKYKNLRVVYDD